jgi:hypothetical protein
MATIVGLFDTASDAAQAGQALIEHGIRHEDISVVAGGSTVGEGAATGAVGGGFLGGVLGALVGLGALAIPGIGPVLAAGPLVAALGSVGAGAVAGAGVGAVGGGLLGALIGAGVPEELAHTYAEGLRRGGTLLAVQTSDEHIGTVRELFQRNGAIDVDARSAEWRAAGWRGFDGSANPSVAEEQPRTPADTPVDSPAASSPGASLGALTGGVVPGTYGAAGDTIFGTDQAEELRRRRESD